jgi:hypothetical protein
MLYQVLPSNINIEQECFFLLKQTKEKYEIGDKYFFKDENDDHIGFKYLKDIKVYNIKDIPEYLCFLEENVDKETWIDIKKFRYKEKPLDENKWFEDVPFTFLLFSSRPSQTQIQNKLYEKFEPTH